MAKPEPESDPRLAARTGKLNVLFALSSLGLLVTTGLMVRADYDREWRQYQVEFNRRRVELTKEQIQKALSPEDAQRLGEIEAQLAQGRKEAEAKRDEIRKVQAEIDALQAEWYASDQEFRFTKAKLDVARYELDEAVHSGSAKADARRKAVRDLERRWEEYRLVVEGILGRSDARKARLAELEKNELAAEKARTALLAEKTRLEELLRRIEPGFVSFVRNLPILDLANPSLKINQIMPSSLYDDVVFTQTPKVDRCTTCHQGIDQKGFENAPQPYTTHPEPDLYVKGPHAIDKVGCTVCHLGRGRGTTFVTAVHTPSTKEQEKAWGKYSGTESYEPMHHWDQPMLARGATQSQCVKCHRGVVEVPKAHRLNAGIELIERYGCYGCHKIKGFETRRKVGPDLGKIASKVSEEFIFRWIKEPRGLRPTRMPQFWDVRIQETPELHRRNDVEANAVVAYLSEKSAKKSYPPPPPGRPRVRAGALREGGLPRLPPRGRGPARHRRPRQRVVPDLRAEPRRHRKQGQRRLALRLAARPQGLLAGDEHAQPAPHPAGSGGHHRLPDEPQERGLHGPRAAPDERRPAGRDRPGVPPRAPPRQAGRGEARDHEGPRSHALPGRADHLPVRLLRLSHDPRLRDDDADRHRAQRGGIEDGRPAGLRLRARAAAPHAARLAPPEAHGAPHLRSRQGQAPVGPAEDAQVPLHVRRGRRGRHRRALPDEGEGPGAGPAAAHGGRGVRGARPAARPGLQLPGLPRHRRPGWRHPGGEGEPARRARKGRRLRGVRSCRRRRRGGGPVSAAPLQRGVPGSGRGPACSRSGFTSS